jgi:hypothetical protein
MHAVSLVRRISTGKQISNAGHARRWQHYGNNQKHADTVLTVASGGNAAEFSQKQHIPSVDECHSLIFCQIGGAMVTRIRILVEALTPWGSRISEMRISPGFAAISISFSARKNPLPSRT